MATWSLSPKLTLCQQGSGMRLETVKGARIGLLQWQSQTTTSSVELPIYIDGWHGPNANASIEQVIVHVHGKERDAHVAWSDMAAARSRVAGSGRTLIVAPQFFNGLDKTKFGDSSRLLVWKSNGWGEGSPAVRPKSGASSFEALDAILCHFADRHIYPSLKRVVLSGHSMGGQLVHRYSILGSPPISPQHMGLEVEYVVMNPASYLYFSPERFGPPASGMNVYKYGFDDIASKLSGYGGIQKHHDPYFYLHRALHERRIHFFHGEADRGAGDERPEAMAQGADRAERARNYHRHLQQMEMSFDTLRGRQWTVEWVPGVKHDGRAMTTSNAAITRIFHCSTG